VSAILLGLLGLLQSLPALLSTIKEIIEIIELWKKDVDSKKKLQDLKEGLKHAKETNDTSKLDAIFNPK